MKADYLNVIGFLPDQSRKLDYTFICLGCFVSCI